MSNEQVAHDLAISYLNHCSFDVSGKMLETALVVTYLEKYESILKSLNESNK